MYNLYMFNETITNGFSYIFLNIFSIGSILCGILVIISKNPIVSVLFLIGLFLNIAGYLIMLGINFIGLSYLLVYIGAVSILFLFILMLINIRVSELITDNNNSIPLAVIIGIFFSITLYNILPSNDIILINSYSIPSLQAQLGINTKTDQVSSFLPTNSTDHISTADSINSIGNIGEKNINIFNIYNNDISNVTSQIWDGALSEVSHITSIGNILYTGYPLWLIITSIILLLAMVGAIIITIKQ